MLGRHGRHGHAPPTYLNDPFSSATLIVVRSSSLRAEAHKKPLAMCCRPSSFSLQITILRRFGVGVCSFECRRRAGLSPSKLSTILFWTRTCAKRQHLISDRPFWDHRAGCDSGLCADLSKIFRMAGRPKTFMKTLCKSCRVEGCRHGISKRTVLLNAEAHSRFFVALSFREHQHHLTYPQISPRHSWRWTGVTGCLHHISSGYISVVR
jgi:hypothetical protein